MGTSLGYEMFVSINKAGLVDGGAYASGLHEQMVSFAGPFITLMQACLALWLIYLRRVKWAFPVLFSALMMRVMAGVVSLSNPNDEARISEWLGIGMWTLPILVVVVLLAMTVLGSRKLKLGWKAWVLSWLVSSIGITLVIFTEPYWPILGG